MNVEVYEELVFYGWVEGLVERVVCRVWWGGDRGENEGVVYEVIIGEGRIEGRLVGMKKSWVMCGVEEVDEMI